jgi:hypothetical protein
VDAEILSASLSVLSSSLWSKAIARAMATFAVGFAFGGVGFCDCGDAF